MAARFGKNGQRVKKIPVQTAATVQALADLDYGCSEIATDLGMPVSSVWNIIRGKGRWSEITKNERLFKEYRNGLKKRMQAKTLAYADGLLDSVYAKKDNGTVSQVALAYGILRDKERLDAGESTENIAHVHKVDVRKIDELASKLSQSIMGTQG